MTLSPLSKCSRSAAAWGIKELKILAERLGRTQTTVLESVSLRRSALRMFPSDVRLHVVKREIIDSNIENMQEAQRTWQRAASTPCMPKPIQPQLLALPG